MSNDRAWETYAPPLMPMGKTLKPFVTFDFRQERIILSRDALTHLGTWRVCVRADRSKYLLEIVPVHTDEAPGASVQRTGQLRGSKEIMQWLRINTAGREAQVLPLDVKQNGKLVADYKSVCSVRAASVARKAEAEEAAAKEAKLSTRMAKVD